MGLYDDDVKDVTGGDLNDQDYWWAKFDQGMFELALKQRQPEGKIGLNIAGMKNRFNELLKKYPKHAELLAWKEKVEAVDKKIDPNASRGGPFNPGCPWDESNYAQLWVNWHYAKKLIEANDYNMARGMLSNVMQNYEIMMRPERMKNYPDDLRKWVEDSRTEGEAMMAACKAKQGY